MLRFIFSTIFFSSVAFGSYLIAERIGCRVSTYSSTKPPWKGFFSGASTPKAFFRDAVRITYVCVSSYVLVLVLAGFGEYSLQIFLFLSTSLVLSFLFRKIFYNQHLVVAIFLGGGFSLAWLLFPSCWVLRVAVSLLVVMAALVYLKDIPGFWVAGICALAVVADFSGAGASNFINFYEAHAEATPAVLSTPDSVPFLAAMSLGIGDIVAPGVLYFWIRRVAQIRGVFYLPHFAMAGYFAGLLLATVVLVEWNFSQPAILYLLPGTMAGYWVGIAFARMRST